jgi:hypothetical protein
MDKVSEAIFKLKPVTHRIKKEINPAQPIAFGGVSIYFPTYDVSPLYSTNLDFAKQTSWTQFLNAFVL